ncbi:MAG: hypothetical protein K6A90_07275 [Lachnospiraceae bacterium]|nr:hypothetical protein [Lachnospiraceae bacterium]
MTGRSAFWQVYWKYKGVGIMLRDIIIFISTFIIYIVTEYFFDFADDSFTHYYLGGVTSNPEKRQRYMGIEFLYKGVYYRMCREPYEEGVTPMLDDGRPGLYNIMIMHCEKLGYPIADSFESIGWYADIQDLLDNCIIDDHPFKDIIMDDSTSIMGKD